MVQKLFGEGHRTPLLRRRGRHKLTIGKKIRKGAEMHLVNQVTSYPISHARQHRAPSLLTSASPEHATCSTRADQALPPPPKLQIPSTGCPLHPRDPTPEFSCSPVHAPLHFDVGVLAQNGSRRLQNLLHRLPPQAQQQFPVGHLRPTAYSPNVSHVVFIGIPRPASVVRAGEQRSEPRAATRPHGSANSTFNQPGCRLDTPALTGSLGLLSTMPGPYSVPALPPHRPRRQHTPQARVTAPPPASPGRRLRRIRPPAARSPSSSQALGYESLMPPPVSHRDLHGLYRFWQLRLSPK
ncbi:hypothetical protein NDU88_003081 [Pleurodeles waltl]|uniref:Uncharacterized protein n=1 Tax=Pleurodeles waltl TaxID=8319 RepID=A0AAV7VD58_PLEWA|nr:hypothetical protein NDU88_003081 [Pleurodeles waltl]